MSNEPVNVGIFGLARGHVNSYCNLWRAEPSLAVRVTADWDHDRARVDFGARVGRVVVDVRRQPAVGEDSPLAVRGVFVALAQPAGVVNQAKDVVVGVLSRPEEAVAGC